MSDVRLHLFDHLILNGDCLRRELVAVAPPVRDVSTWFSHSGDHLSFC